MNQDTPPREEADRLTDALMYGDDSIRFESAGDANEHAA